MSKDRNIIFLYGNDEYAISRRLKEFEAVFADETTAGMNISRLDARTMSAADLYNAVNSLPFLADHRLLLLANPSKRYVGRKSPKKVLAQAGSPPVDENPASGEDEEAVEAAGDDQGLPDLPTEARGKFLELLAVIPPTTRLVISEFMDLKTNRERAAAENHWLVTWIKKAGQSLERFALPDVRDMPGWIARQVIKEGGKIEPGASKRLGELVGADTLQAVQEIAKLLTYVNWKRPITAADVESVSSYTAEPDIFTMVDALAKGNGGEAQLLLHRFLENGDTWSTWGMIVRQFRLLVLAREVIDSGGRQRHLQDALGVHQVVAEKAFDQAQRFTLPSLERIYHRLLEIDLAAKTGRMPLDLGMELLVVELAR